MKLVLGNRDAVQSVDNGETFERLPNGKRSTTVEPPDGLSLVEIVRVVDSLWPRHAAEGAVPAWIAGDHAGAVALIADHFGGIEIRELEE